MSEIQAGGLVYVVEDSQSSGALYCSYLNQAGYTTQHFLDGHSALVGIKEKMPDVIVQDVCLPDISGLEVLQFVNRQDAPARVVIITANSSIDVAVDAMRLGGFDFMEKPFSKERLLSAVHSAIDQLEVESVAAVETPVEPSQKASEGGVRGYFVGESASMSSVFRLLDSAAKSKASVFVTGESGTGKEVCALSLHKASARRDGPFVPINCAAIPADLFESEIFGHEKGAFSGAVNQRKGAAEQADGGTLFLDELCEMDLNLQAKLLRFLQTGSFTRVGGHKQLSSDIRIVCATNRDPEVEVREGRFREDLFYRLNVIPVHLPPLRDRAGDAVLLAEHFLREKTKLNHKSFKGFSSEAMAFIRDYEWPGNIREMQNVIENAVVINEGDFIELDMLPIAATTRRKTMQVSTSQAAPTAAAPRPITPAGMEGIRPLWIVEKEAIESAIAQCNDNIPLAAACLGVSASTIYRKKKSWESGGEGG